RGARQHPAGSQSHQGNRKAGSILMSTTDARNQAAKARAELAATLDAIEDRLNVPKRANELAQNAAAAHEKHPLPWIIGGVAVAVIAAGLVAWAIFSDDDD